MKILYVAPNYPPEVAGPRVPELARRFVALGHNVTVLTGFPNYPTGIVPPEYRSRMRRGIYRETMDGVSVVRTWMIPAPNRKPVERILNYCSFFLSACVTGLFLPRPDVVIGSSPQLLAALAGRWLSAVKRVPFVFEARDLWPDSLFAAGVGRPGSFMGRILSAISRFLYARCDRLVAVTPASRDELIERWNVPPAKIAVITNGVETDLFSPAVSTDSVKAQFQLSERFWVTYTGTIGLAHGLETVLTAAEILQKKCPKAAFLMVGAGADRERLTALAAQRQLSNITFIPEQPRSQIPAFLQISGACLVLLKKAPIFKTVIPSKMLEFMSSGKPLILGVDGQARQIMEAAGAGLFIEPENPAALADAVKTLADDVALRQTMGTRGRAYILQNFSRKKTAVDYVALLEELAFSKPWSGSRV